MNSTIDSTTIDRMADCDLLRLARHLYDSAVANYAESHVKLAESLFRRALYVFEKQVNPAGYDAVVVMISLGMIHEDRHEYGAAEQMYQRAAIVTERAANDGDADLATLRLQLWAHMGRVNRVQGRHDRAEAFARRASEIAVRFFGFDALAIAG